MWYGRELKRRRCVTEGDWVGKKAVTMK